MTDYTIIQNSLPALQVVVPLLLAPIAVLVTIPFLSWLIALAGSLFCLYSSISLYFLVSEIGKINYYMGGWLPPYGIEYIIDDASAFMIVLISLMGVFATIYAFQSLKKEINKKSQSRVYGMWLLALGGLLGLVTTGDAFNLFVFLEISSLSSVTLVALGSKNDKRALTAAFNYLLIGAVGATFYVIGVGLLYSVFINAISSSSIVPYSLLMRKIRARPSAVVATPTTIAVRIKTCGKGFEYNESL